jgi:acetyltransferase-like isoleucine patch superfamily enzyme
MSLRRLFTIRKKYSLWSIFLSAGFMCIKNWNQRITQLFIYPKSIILNGNAHIGIHHLTKMKLQDSRIIVDNGTLKVGIDYGYYDGGMFDSKRDVCRMHLINSTLRINGDVSLYPGVQVFAQNAEIIIGNGTKINGNTQIVALNKIEIGDDCYIAQGVIIRDNDGHKLSADETQPIMNCLPVKIGNHCWLGQRAMVLKGASIADNVVIAAGAIVTKDIEQGTLAGGIPAKPIFSKVVWEE